MPLEIFLGKILLNIETKLFEVNVDVLVESEEMLSNGIKYVNLLFVIFFISSRYYLSLFKRG